MYHKCLCPDVSLLVSHSVAAEGLCPLARCSQVAGVLSCHRGTHALPLPHGYRTLGGHAPPLLFSPSQESHVLSSTTIPNPSQTAGFSVTVLNKLCVVGSEIVPHHLLPPSCFCVIKTLTNAPSKVCSIATQPRRVEQLSVLGLHTCQTSVEGQKCRQGDKGWRAGRHAPSLAGPGFCELSLSSATLQCPCPFSALLGAQAQKGELSEQTGLGSEEAAGKPSPCY